MRAHFNVLEPAVPSCYDLILQHEARSLLHLVFLVQTICVLLYPAPPGSHEAKFREVGCRC